MRLSAVSLYQWLSLFRLNREMLVEEQPRPPGVVIFNAETLFDMNTKTNCPRRVCLVNFERIAPKLHLLVLELALDFTTIRKDEFIVAIRQFSCAQLPKEASLILGETREDPLGSSVSYYEKDRERSLDEAAHRFKAEVEAFLSNSKHAVIPSDSRLLMGYPSWRKRAYHVVMAHFGFTGLSFAIYLHRFVHIKTSACNSSSFFIDNDGHTIANNFIVMKIGFEKSLSISTYSLE